MNENCVISVIGPHAGESVESIFKRKMEDIDKTGITFWLINSSLCRVHNVIEKAFDGMRVFFIEPAVKGGSKNTKVSSVAGKYSIDGIQWFDINPNLSDVTGRINKGTSCLVLKNLALCDSEIDLCGYSDVNGVSPLKFKLGASTALAFKTSSIDFHKTRKVVAIGELANPYSVFVSEKKS